MHRCKVIRWQEPFPWSLFVLKPATMAIDNYDDCKFITDNNLIQKVMVCIGHYTAVVDYALGPSTRSMIFFGIQLSEWSATATTEWGAVCSLHSIHLFQSRVSKQREPSKPKDRMKHIHHIPWPICEASPFRILI